MDVRVAKLHSLSDRRPLRAGIGQRPHSVQTATPGRFSRTYPNIGPNAAPDLMAAKSPNLPRRLRLSLHVQRGASSWTSQSCRQSQSLDAAVRPAIPDFPCTREFPEEARSRCVDGANVLPSTLPDAGRPDSGSVAYARHLVASKGDATSNHVAISPAMLKSRGRCRNLYVDQLT